MLACSLCWTAFLFATTTQVESLTAKAKRGTEASVALAAKVDLLQGRIAELSGAAIHGGEEAAGGEEAEAQEKAAELHEARAELVTATAGLERCVRERDAVSGQRDALERELQDRRSKLDALRAADSKSKKNLLGREDRANRLAQIRNEVGSLG